jgi:hypothetical protein
VHKRKRASKGLAGSKGENLRDVKPQESIGSVLCAIPVCRTRLFEGNKALESTLSDAYPAGCKKAKGQES